MIFPEFKNKKSALISVDTESVLWLKNNTTRFLDNTKNPFCTPEICSELIRDIHLKYNIEWSYGGYLEDRKNIWKDTYLSKTGAFIHLGVDFNVPCGTHVAPEFDSVIVMTGFDSDTDGGWGSYIVLKPLSILKNDILFVFGHLQNISCEAHARLSAGTKIAEIGSSENNGNWYPHLHIQAMRANYFFDDLKSHLLNTDGYSSHHEIEKLKMIFPNPLDLIHI